MRVAIVNDLRLAVVALQRALADLPDCEIAWIAADGAEAVQKCAADTPDLILMDLIMPVMDGVEATRRIMAASPCAILVVTATVTGNARKVFEAMGAGALDAVCTPTLAGDGSVSGRDPLMAKLATMAKLLRRSSATATVIRTAARVTRLVVPRLVAIGTSTGGPVVLAEILARLPTPFPGALVIIQHVDPQFAAGFASWLNDQSAIPTRLAVAGEPVVAGTAYLADTAQHLVLSPDLRLLYTDEPRRAAFRPSVDAFFESAAQFWPDKGLGILLTGIGRDGAQGLLRLREAGWHTIAQDEETSIVYGMPKAAAEIHAAVEILPLDKVPAAIAAFCAAGA